MAVYYRFGPSDIIHYSLSTTPKVEASSGSAGWSGNTGTSGSVSMYGGIRSRVHPTNDFKINYTYKLPTYSIDGLLTLSGTYPSSGSLTYVSCRNLALDLNDVVHAGLWGREHFSPIMNLYDYYGRDNTDYTTGSYDYYMLYFESGSQNKVVFSGSLFANMTSSFTLEAMIKPLSISGSNKDYTIMSRAGRWAFGITGSTGQLLLSSSNNAMMTSSDALTQGRWQHVAAVYDGSTLTFKINLLDSGQSSFTAIATGAGTTPINVGFNQANTINSFHGFMFDAKVWHTARTDLQLSSSFDRTMMNSGSTALKLYARFNDGPKISTHTFTAGSGAFNYSPTVLHGQLVNFDTRVAPIWHPNDNPTFITSKKLLANTISDLKVVHVPSMYYGRQIATGSVKLVCNAFTSSKLQRTIVDDGRGGLYISGSATSGTLEDRESYKGVQWNKVGNVFYSEGLIVIKDPSLLDFGLNNPVSQLQNDLLQVNFKGKSNIPTKVFMCRVHGAKANASNNSSFVAFDSGSDKHKIVRDDNTTYITAVGIYNKERKLVAVAKLASPVRKKEIEKLNIKLKMDL